MISSATQSRFSNLLGQLIRAQFALCLALILPPTAGHAQRGQDVRKLISNQPVERRMSGGEAHSYELAFTAGQFARVIVLQRGIDVILKLTDPAGKELARIDNYNSTLGPESLSYIAEMTGAYRLEVSAFKKTWLQSPYTISVEVRALPTDDDKKRVTAEGLVNNAHVLTKRGTKESNLQAAAKLDAAMTLWRDLKDQYWQAQTLQDIGSAYKDAGAYEKALDALNQSLSLWRGIGDRSGEARDLLEFGNLYYAKADVESAANYYAQVQMLSHKIGDIFTEARGLFGLGLLYYYKTKQPKKGLPYYQEALSLFISLKDVFNEAESLRMEAQTYYYNTSDYPTALELYQKALPLYQELGEQSSTAYALNSIGNAYYSMKEYESALEYYNRALVLSRSASVSTLQASVLNNIGDVYFRKKEYAKAVEFYSQALPIGKEVKDATKIESILSNLAVTCWGLKREKEALTYYNQLLTLQSFAQDREKEAGLLNRVGNLYYSDDQYSKALGYYNRAIALLGQNQKTDLSATLLANLGNANKQIDNYGIALRNYQNALLIRESLNDTEAQADILNRIGATLYLLDRQKDALVSHTRALALQKDRPNEAKSLWGMGRVYSFFGESEKALDYFNRALVIQQEIRDEFGEMSTLSDIGAVYEALDNREQALKYYNLSLEKARHADSRSGEAQAISNIADVYFFHDEYQTALDNYTRALEFFQRIEDRGGQADSLNNIGNVYEVRDQYQQALEQFGKALTISEEIEDPSGTALALSNIGDVYSKIGDDQQALTYYERALRIQQQIGNKPNEVSSLRAIAGIYFDFSDYQQALAYCNQSLSISRTIGDKSGESDSLNLLGIISGALHDRKGEIKDYEASLEIDKVLGNHAGESTLSLNLGIAYYYSDQYDAAINYFNRDLEISQTIGDVSGEASARYWIARMSRYRKDYTTAKSQIELAIAIIERIRGKITNESLRTSYFASVQSYYELYIDVLMRLEKEVPNRGYAALALKASERARARVLIELLSQSHVDIIRGVEPQLVQREKDLQKQIESLTQKRLKLLSSSSQPLEQTKRIETELGHLEDQLQQIKTEIRSKSPKYSALTQPQALGLAEIQTQVLDSDTLLLEYSLGEAQSYLWAVTSTSINSYVLPGRAVIEPAAHKVYDLFTTTRQSSNPSKRSSARLKRPNKPSPQRFVEAVGALSTLLLGPVLPQTRGKRLLIVADGALQYVPFGALLLPTSDNLKANQPEPLIFSNEIVTLPSASTLAVIRAETKDRRPAARSIAVFADPVFESTDIRVRGTRFTATTKAERRSRRPITWTVAGREFQRAVRDARANREGLPRLPGTRVEARELQRLVPASEFEMNLDFAANRAAALNPEVGQYRYVHFATHGLLDSQHPELSGVALSMVNERGEPQDGYLRAQDVFNLNLPAEVVVLSACQTGLGKEIKGEGMIGLTRGFMYAGAPRVIVSLWSVNDAATADLMGLFYKGMLEHRMRPAAALRAAQISLAKGERYSAPFYWAAFTLQGEWR